MKYGTRRPLSSLTCTRQSLAGLVHYCIASTAPAAIILWYALEDDDEIKTANQSHEFIKYKILYNNFSD